MIMSFLQYKMIREIKIMISLSNKKQSEIKILEAEPMVI